MIRLLIILSLLFVLGCEYPSIVKQRAAEAEIQEQRAAILKAYRFCLEKYAAEPPLAKANCEHYTQSLQAIDVRGMR